jgi:hypothetical protein
LLNQSNFVKPFRFGKPNFITWKPAFGWSSSFSRIPAVKKPSNYGTAATGASTDIPNAACAATAVFGLRRETQRHAAFGSWWTCE